MNKDISFEAKFAILFKDFYVCLYDCVNKIKETLISFP